MRNQQFRILSFIIIIYMLCAILWWAVLLQRNNATIYGLNRDLIALDASKSPAQIEMDIAVLEKQFERKSYMIMGEGIVIAITLALGMFFVNRALIRELKASEKQKNFLLSITHELKSPLASIHLILDTFIKRKLPQEKIEELSEDALSETNRLENLFNKILLATRLDTSYSYYKQEENLGALTTQELDIYGKLHPDLLIKKNIENNLVVSIDPEAYASMFKNLIENAIKYGGDEKTIEINLFKRKHHAILEVADLGEGIPDSEKKKVTEQFYRIGSEETRKSKGTGLGLYIVNEIVQAHKGKLEIKDNHPRGTRFIITLPIKTIK